jgi:pectinesterase
LRHKKYFFDMKKLMLILALLAVYGDATAKGLAKDYSKYITVAQDGSGDFTSIQKAIESCKSFPYERITIFIKKGIYHEKVTIPSWNTKVSLVGQSKDSTIITYGDYFAGIGKGPNSTFYTATLTVRGNDFQAENLTIVNSAGPVGQAIALDVEADRCSFVNCRITGNQDTLYAAGQNARQYFSHCTIEGTTDFIFGEATALFEDCRIVCKADACITAASTAKGTAYGFVFKDCMIEASPRIDKVFLGRPWRKYAKTVFIRCNMGAFISPGGWDNWRNPDNEKTAYYAEYQSTGAGADPAERVGWSKQLTGTEARQYSLTNIFSGNPTWKPAIKQENLR